MGSQKTILAGVGALLGLIALAGMQAGAQKPLNSTLTYEKDILPLFQARCLACHGATQKRTGLDLRTLGRVVQGGHSGSAIQSGTPEKSLLYTVLASGKMPPSGAKLNPAELRKVADWIRTGAQGTTAAQRHWAFSPPKMPSVPKTKGSVRNSVDSFLLAELEKNGLAFSVEADRKTLLRRVFYDLVGLPPTPEETAAFLSDNSTNAYEKQVDRLLADPRYGERWARRWLDTAGYADSEGVLQEDRLRPNAWRYRDYVIRSLNADKPYDRFLKEQIAGDELVEYRNAPKWTPEIEEVVTATGFLRTAVDATREDFNDHQFSEYQHRMLNDTQTILVSTTLGITLHCARCHNHKFEPLSQKDYYRVQATLAGAIRPKGKLLPTYRRQLLAGTLEEQKRAAEVTQKADAAIQGLRAQEAALLRTFRLQYLQDLKASVVESDRAALLQAFQMEEGKRDNAQKALLEKYKLLVEKDANALATHYPEFAQKRGELQTQVAKESAKRVILHEIRALYDQDATPPPTKLLIRGELERPSETIEAGVPTILEDANTRFRLATPAKEGVTTGRRRALAEWLTRRENPLTARVLVNRIWEGHFGVGLVATLDNFGVSGAEPTNQPLLDWLACQFMKGLGGATPWSVKPLHRLIVTSAAYRQASRLRPEPVKIDPANRLLWRQRVRRLEAEAIRDGMLAVSGSLDATLFGEPVQEEVRGTGEVVPVGEDKPSRRSLYLLVRRSLPVSFLQVFDAPIMETNCTRRVTSTTATQALALLNSGFMAIQGERFAQRVLKEGAEDAARLQRAYTLAFSRLPSKAEVQSCLTFLEAQRGIYVRGGKSAEEANRFAYRDLCHALLSANEFVYVD